VLLCSRAAEWTAAFCALSLQRTHDIASSIFSYGPADRARELQGFHDVAGALDAASRLVIRMGHLAANRRIQPDRYQYSRLSRRSRSQRHSSSYVPFRNANLLSAAVSWAEVLGRMRCSLGPVGRLIGYPRLPKVVFPGV